MDPAPIPFNRAELAGRELDYITAAIDGGHISSSGPFTERASSILRDELDAAGVLLTGSCTSALEMAAMLLDPRPGDTVVVPSFTFVTTALAFAREGFRIVFADIEPRTLGVDPDHVASLIDERTRAVVAVHYGGIPCDLTGLTKVLGEHPGVDLIEDNAHGLFGRYDGVPLGGFGRLSTLSFHETKNIVCGEGGALVVNRTTDLARARVLLDKGTDRQRFLDGEVDKYTWRDTGSSFGLSDINAAFLLGQLEERRAILDRRRAIWDRYTELLSPVAAELDLTLPSIPADAQSGYHLFSILLPDAGHRAELLDRMGRQGVHATFHYVPLHSSDGGRAVADRPTECPVTDDVSSRLVRLPFFNTLTDAEVERVVDVLVTNLRALHD